MPQIQWDPKEVEEKREQLKAGYRREVHKEIWLFREGFRPIEPLEEGNFKEAKN